VTCRYYGYAIEFEQDEPEGWVATVPGLPGCIGYGATVEDAKDVIYDEINMYIDLLNEQRDLLNGEE
jgi:predicted RNase H-like HicB family nuclease